MPLQIIRNDITTMDCDAIVAPTDRSLSGSGGVDAAIHRAAGAELDAACRRLGSCEVGQAKLTGAYRLPCRCVIHTVGPQWLDGKHDEEAQLASCYWESLRLARRRLCSSVAFPLIATGSFGFPKDIALQIAVREIRRFLQEHEMDIYLVVYDRLAYQLSHALSNDIREYIDEKYVDTHRPSRRFSRREQADFLPGASAPMPDYSTSAENYSLSAGTPRPSARPAMPSFSRPQSLDEALRTIDESFSQMLLRKIDEKGMSDSECYKKANIDRKLFSKIRGDIHYRPKKTTALAFAIALELPLEETRELLEKAGFALSHSSKFDIIIEYFVMRGNYDVFEINEALFAFDQPLLGA